MSDIAKLEQLVRERYEKKNPDRDRWSDWMYENHIFDVADNAEKLAHQFNASPDACRAAALLHDIADSELSREDPTHKEKNLIIAEELLKVSSFSESEIEDILGDALPFHSCHGDERPKTLVGKILSTADALTHLNTEFYSYFNSAFAAERSETESRQKAREKIQRDFDKKIAFDDIREDARERYNMLIKQYG